MGASRLPSWEQDLERWLGVPEGIEGRSKGQVALEEIDRLIAGGVTFDCVLGDAEYGKAAAFRQGLSGRHLI